MLNNTMLANATQLHKILHFQRINILKNDIFTKGVVRPFVKKNKYKKFLFYY